VPLHDSYVLSCVRMQVGTEGDAFIIAFHSPKDAVLWACECQTALLHAVRGGGGCLSAKDASVMCACLCKTRGGGLGGGGGCMVRRQKP
jgi:hypothetical protein